MKTLISKQIQNNQRKWYIVDAKDRILGKLAIEVAKVLRGKNKVDFAPHTDNGDYVIVINASDITVTGKKESDKVYHTHSGHLGGLKTTTFKEMKEKKPTEMLKLAISGMLPKNKLRKDMLDRLKLEIGSTHSYEAQKPINLNI